MCAVHLIESPKKILRCAIDVVAAGVVGEVVAQRGAWELLPEQIDLVQEEDDACPHEPSRIHHRIEKDQALHHSILQYVSSVGLIT